MAETEEPYEPHQIFCGWKIKHEPHSGLDISDVVLFLCPGWDEEVVNGSSRTMATPTESSRGA